MKAPAQDHRSGSDASARLTVLPICVMVRWSILRSNTKGILFEIHYSLQEARYL
jgi:hypothetical protein